MDDDSAVLNSEVQRWLLLAMPWWSSPPGNPNRLSSGPETDTCHEVSTSPLALLYLQQRASDRSYPFYGSGYFTLSGSRGGRCPPLASPRGGGGGGGAFWSQGGAFRFFTNIMIFLECGVIALFEAFYMFRDHNHVKMKF